MRSQNLIRIVAAVVLLLTVVACAMPAQGLIRAGTGTGVANNWLKVDRMGSTAIDSVQLQTAIGQLPPGDLSTAEREALLYMREEEKLAHDVYVTLAAQWPLPIFQNITNSEATHTEAVQVLLDRYGLTDPTGDNGIGSFTDATLQALYDQLVAEGSQSLAAALRVGATIEDLDIVDLQDRLAQTDNADVEQVFTNLTRGSRNHLRAFTRMLAQEAGERYTPQYLDQARYDEIINSAMEQGSSGRGRHGR